MTEDFRVRGFGYSCMTNTQLEQGSSPVIVFGLYSEDPTANPPVRNREFYSVEFDLVCDQPEDLNLPTPTPKYHTINAQKVFPPGTYWIGWRSNTKYYARASDELGNEGYCMWREGDWNSAMPFSPSVEESEYKCGESHKVDALIIFYAKYETGTFCDPLCVNGICNVNKTCECFNGWAPGSNGLCDQCICCPACETNNGQCVEAVGRCHCNQGYTGNQCKQTLSGVSSYDCTFFYAI